MSWQPAEEPETQNPPACKALQNVIVPRPRDLGGFDDGERYDVDSDRDYDCGSYRRADPRGDPFVIWQERDERGPH